MDFEERAWRAESRVAELEAKLAELEGVREAYQRILDRVGEFDRENKQLREALAAKWCNCPWQNFEDCANCSQSEAKRNTVRVN